MTKLTNKVALTLALDALTSVEQNGGSIPCDFGTFNDVREKIQKMIDSLDKKAASTSTKPSKKSVENDAIKEQIFKLVTVEGVRAGDVAKELDISGQKASALLNQMVDSKRIQKLEGEKRVTLFALLSE